MQCLNTFVNLQFSMPFYLCMQGKEMKQEEAAIQVRYSKTVIPKKMQQFFMYVWYTLLTYNYSYMKVEFTSSLFDIAVIHVNQLLLYTIIKWLICNT